MQLIIAAEDGTVVEVIEHVEAYDLSKPLAQQSLMEEIREALDRGTGTR